MITRPPGADQPSDDYVLFCRAVFTQTDLDLGAYKRNQMERRVRGMAAQAGAQDLTEFWALLRRDAQALRTFLDKVTINVSEFLRNPEKFEEFRAVIFPELFQARRPLLIWSAGCSYGAEPYSIALLLRELTPGVKHRIWASDVDDGVLARARQGAFTAADLKHVPDALKARYFTAGPSDMYTVTPALRQGVEFARHDLLRDPFPTRVDVIFCRNVVIYFNDVAKERLFRGFFEALRPGGYLLVGSTERIASAAAIGFQAVRQFWYRRPLDAGQKG